MESTTRISIAAIGVSLFGLFLLWQGFSGKISKLSDGKPVLPRWVYIVGGLFVLILPVAYLVLMLQVK